MCCNRVRPLRFRPKRLFLAVLLVMAVVLVGCAGDRDDAAGPDGGTELEVMGTDSLKFEPSTLTADEGDVTVALTAGPAIRHTFVIEELGDEEVVAAEAGETATGTVDLDSGSYTFYCSVPGHRSAGMEGTLTVG